MREPSGPDWVAGMLERELTAADFTSGAPAGCRSSHPAGCFVACYSPGPVGIGSPASAALCDACSADVHRVIGGG